MKRRQVSEKGAMGYQKKSHAFCLRPSEERVFQHPGFRQSLKTFREIKVKLPFAIYIQGIDSRWGVHNRSHTNLDLQHSSLSEDPEGL